MCETIKLKRSTRQSRDPQSGFTLVELLLVITIIAVLSGMGLGVMKKAQDDAKAAATQARILQIESLLAIQLENYEVRRLPISNRELVAYVTANRATDGADDVPIFAQVRALRRQILMDIINSEIPRAYLDAGGVFVPNPDLGKFPSNEPPVVNGAALAGGFRDWLDANYSVQVGAVTLANRLEYLETSGIKSLKPLIGGPDLPGEYLYAVLQRMDVDGTPGIELMGNAAIGNTDDDNYPELVDAWGEPMQLRIWQVDAVAASTRPGQYADGVSAVVYEDVDPIDFDLADPANGGAPTGYVGLNPQQPREIQKIRFQVVSTRLGVN